MIAKKRVTIHQSPQCSPVQKVRGIPSPDRSSSSSSSNGIPLVGEDSNDSGSNSSGVLFQDCLGCGGCGVWVEMRGGCRYGLSSGHGNGGSLSGVCLPPSNHQVQDLDSLSASSSGSHRSDSCSDEASVNFQDSQAYKTVITSSDFKVNPGLQDGLLQDLEGNADSMEMFKV
jgi:hypothetical protein